MKENPVDFIPFQKQPPLKDPNELPPELIKVNGNLISVVEYKKNAEYYNSQPIPQDLLDSISQIIPTK